MISCLVNYIGLKSITTPVSGRCVNELAGIDTAQFGLISKEEAYSIEQAWDELENRAINKFESKIKLWAKRYFAQYSYIRTRATSQYEGYDPIAQSSNYAGWYFENEGASNVNLSLVITTAQIYADNTGTSELKVFDTNTGEELDSISFTFEANTINKVNINKSYPCWKYPNIFVCYNESDIEAIETELLSGQQKRVAQSSSVINTNLEAISSGQGMNLMYSLDCSLDNYVCGRIQLFEEAYMYLLGAEFMLERVYSDRLSTYTTLDRDRAKELLEYYTGEYTEKINEVLNGLKIDDDGVCFECERAINQRVLLP